MPFFEFSASEWVSENFKIHMHIEPVGGNYQYRLTFDDGKNNAYICGSTSTAYGSILEIRNQLVSVIDTLSDCTEHVKMAAHDIETMQDWNDEDDEEEENDGEKNGI